MYWSTHIGANEFQSTPPSREATLKVCCRCRVRQDFNPRLPHGRRLPHREPLRGHANFNPRLPHGRRHLSRRSSFLSWLFQSTPPSREATFRVSMFSIPRLFQSTPPSREATTWHRSILSRCLFQSTPPSREATISSADMKL